MATEGKSEGTAALPRSVGAFELVRPLAIAPGATLAEGRDPSGELRLIQLATCRAPRSRDDEQQLDEYTRMVAAATAHFDGDPDLRVLAHGSEVDELGRRLLYWAMPWKEGAERLGRAESLISVPSDLVSVAVSLLARVLERHERGRLDPLLSEQTIIIRPSGDAIVAGVPIHLPVEGLDPEALHARLAPEEELRAEPTQSGDVWRIGRALQALSQGLEPLPAALRRVIDALADPDPELRLVDPIRAMRELEDLGSGIDETAAIPVPAGAWRRREEALPSAEELADSFRDGTDPLPLANMRAAPPTPPSMAHSRIAEAPTLLEVRPPASLRARAAAELDSRRRAGMPLPNILSADTLVDSLPHPQTPALFGEQTIDDGIYRRSADPAELEETLDPGDPPTLNDIRRPAPTAKASVWDQAPRAAEGPAMGRGGTLVGARKIGPAGTLVGVKPVRARELLSRELADLPTMPAPPAAPPEVKAQTSRAMVGVPRVSQGRAEPPGREAPTGLAGDPFALAPRSRALAGMDTGDFEPPASIRSVLGGETSDEIPVSPELAARAAAALAAAQNERLAAAGGQPPAGPSPSIVAAAEPSIHMEPAVTMPQISLAALGLLPPGSVPAAHDPGPFGQWPKEQPAQPPPAVHDPALLAGAAAAAALGLAQSESGQPGTAQPGTAQPGTPGGSATAAGPKAPVKPKRSWLKLAANLLVLAVVLAAAAVGAGRRITLSEPSKEKAPKPDVITSANEVVLTVSPEDAVVVGEDDGKVLGTTPMSFFVAPSSTHAVLVVARDREPQRLVLPDHGNVTLSLKRSTAAAGCEVQLEPPTGVVLEAVSSTAGRLASGAERWAIPSSTVFRAARGPVGAWLVRCPEPGAAAGKEALQARPPTTEQRIHLAEPPNLLFFADGRLGGTTPNYIVVDSGLVLVRVQTIAGPFVERWVTVSKDTLLRMPAPEQPVTDEY